MPEIRNERPHAPEKYACGSSNAPPFAITACNRGGGRWLFQMGQFLPIADTVLSPSSLCKRVPGTGHDWFVFFRITRKIFVRMSRNRNLDREKWADGISVVVPVYNVRNLLDRCVESLLAQTLRHFELLLVDDGSTDGSGERCDWWAAQDSRIRVLHQANAGQSAARNRGVRESTGTWIAFVDSDDYVAPEYLEYLWRLRAEPGVGISMCMFALTHGEPLEPSEPDEPVVCGASEACLRLVRGDGMSEGPWCKLYRRDLLEACPFPEGRVYEDTAVMGRLVHMAGKVAAGRRVLYGYFQNPASTMRSRDPKKLRDQLEAHREAAEFLQMAGEKQAARVAWDKMRGVIMEDVKGGWLPLAELRAFGKGARRGSGAWGVLGVKCRLALLCPWGYRFARGRGRTDNGKG